MSAITDIKNTTWGLSTLGYGVIAEGLANVRQCLDIIIRTSKGTDPLRMEFGSDVYKFVDAPVGTSIPNIKKEILNAIEIWEPRVSVTKIDHDFIFVNNKSQLAFNIAYILKDQNLIDQITLILNGSDLTIDTDNNEVILQAFFPPNPNGYRYYIKFIINSLPVLPPAYPAGFASIAELFAWVISNWAFFGKWYLLQDKIILYLKSADISNASLEIGIKPIYKYEALLPVLGFGQKYLADFTFNGIHISGIPGSISTPGFLLQWFQNNLLNYGTWSLEFNAHNNSFSDEFSNEFFISTAGYTLILVSETISNGVLNVTAN